ncbi:MAG: ABC transporter substrate-binding protein [Dehalococcoidia bacterium]|nr:ABC transporter substrate-binding protein [Dehalococcoidia bacterium]
MKARRLPVLMVPMVLLFVLGVACGGEEPTATPAPAAGVSAEDISSLVAAAVAAQAQPGASAEEIQAIVDAATAAAAESGVTGEELAMAIDNAVSDAVSQAVAPAPTPTPFVAMEEKRKLTVALNTFDSEEIAPHLSGNLSAIALVQNYSDHLMGLTVDNEFTNQWGLSKSWEQIDGRTYEFTIKEGIKFHDGDDFTVEDAKGSIELLASEDAVASSCLYCNNWAQLLESIVIQGPDRLRIHLTRDEPFLYDIIAPKAGADSYLASKRKWEESGGNSQGWEAAGAPGTGPWDFIDRGIGSFSRFEAWDGYYSPAFKAKFDELEFILTAEDAPRVAQVKTGEVDLAISSGVFVDEIRAAGLDIRGPQQVDSLYLNFYQSRDPAHCTNKLEVRKALNLAVDVGAIASALYAPGTYSRSASPFFTPFDEGWRPDLQPYGYDPEEAKRLIDEHCPNMKMTVYAFAFGVAPEMVDAQDAAVTYYKAIGIDAELIPTDWTAVNPIVRGSDQLISEQGIPNPSGVHVIPAARNFGEKIRTHGLWGDVGGSVDGIWSEKYVDLRLQYASDTNPVTRRALAQRVAKLMYDEYVNIPIAFRNLIYASNPETVCGWTPINGTQVGLMFNTVEPCR